MKSPHTQYTAFERESSTTYICMAHIGGIGTHLYAKQCSIVSNEMIWFGKFLVYSS